MEAALVIPPALTGKALKVVTSDYNDSNVQLKPLRGKEYDDNTSILTPLKDIIEALGGKYTELDIDNMNLG